MLQTVRPYNLLRLLTANYSSAITSVGSKLTTTSRDWRPHRRAARYYLLKLSGAGASRPRGIIY